MLQEILKPEIPISPTNAEMINLLSQKLDWINYTTLKNISKVKDDILADWLNINVKTFRAYKKQNSKINENVIEHIILLLSLFEHGKEVFGTTTEFYEWLNKDNLFLDNKKPANYLKTISGIRFIDDRLVSIEYGDNV